MGNLRLAVPLCHEGMILGQGASTSPPASRVVLIWVMADSISERQTGGSDWPSNFMALHRISRSDAYSSPFSTPSR